MVDRFSSKHIRSTHTHTRPNIVVQFTFRLSDDVSTKSESWTVCSLDEVCVPVCGYQWSRWAACGLRWWTVWEWGSLRFQTLQPAPSPLWRPLWPNASLALLSSASQQPLHNVAPAVDSGHTREHLHTNTNTHIESSSLYTARQWV